MADVETGRAARDHIKQRRGDDGADDLRDHIGHDLAGRKAAAGGKTDGDGGIEMTAGNVADGIGHRDDAQPERQRHPDQSDTDLREAGGDHRAAASCKGQPERPDRLGGIFFCVHGTSSLICFGCQKPGKSPL